MYDLFFELYPSNYLFFLIRGFLSLAILLLLGFLLTQLLIPKGDAETPYLIRVYTGLMRSSMAILAVVHLYFFVYLYLSDYDLVNWGRWVWGVKNIYFSITPIISLYVVCIGLFVFSWNKIKSLV